MYLMIFKYLGIPILFGVILGGAWFYYNTTEKSIENLTVQNTQLIGKLDKIESELERKREEYKQIEKRTNELRANLEEAEEYRNELLEKLQRHDLTRLSLQKPGLIEKRINDATKKLFEDFESITSTTHP